MNIKLFSLLLLLLLLVRPNGDAQTAINNKFPFSEGIYAQYPDFQQNKPSFALSALTKLEYELNAEENVLILKSATQKQLDSLSAGKVWGICINQVPYIRTEDKKGGNPYFVRLHVVGKLCYFYYKAFREKEVTMYIHNPYTGERIGQRNITNKELVSVEKLLHFNTGETIDFNFENLKLWTADDAGLNKSLKEIKPNEVENKLFKSLLIYNDRNPVYIVH